MIESDSPYPGDAVMIGSPPCGPRLLAGLSDPSTSVVVVQPWDDDDARPSRPDSWDHARKPKPGWGCAIAAIIGSVATVVAIVIVVKFLAGLINPGDLTP